MHSQTERIRTRQTRDPVLLLPLCCRVTGDVSAFYFDPSSSPDQSLNLKAVRAAPAGFAFPAYELV